MAGWIRYAGSKDLWHLQADWDGAPLCGWKGGKAPATRVPLYLHSSFKEEVLCARCTRELAYFHSSVFASPPEEASHSYTPTEVTVSTEDQGIKATLSELLLGEPALVSRLDALESRLERLEARRRG